MPDIWTPERLREEAARDVDRRPLVRVGNCVKYNAFDGTTVGGPGVVVEIDPGRAGPPFHVRWDDEFEEDHWYWWANLRVLR